MLEQLKQQVEEYAMVKFAGDKSLVASFMDGFEKQANQGGGQGGGKGGQGGGGDKKEPKPEKGLGDFFGEGMSTAVGKGLGGMAVGLGLHGLNQAFATVAHGALHTKFLEALSRAIAINPILQNAEKERVQNYAETVFKFAPHVATDSNLLSSILANAIHGEGIDPMTIKTLGDLESRFIENRTSGGFSPKQYV
jgi:hypothetical protein